jgi:hypothetical protein
MGVAAARNCARIGLFAVAGALGCAVEGAALAGPTAPGAAATPQIAAATSPASPAGWPSAQDATRPGRPTPVADPTPSGGCVRPIATASGDPQRDLELKLSGPRTLKAGEHPQLSAQLRNVSRSRAHHVVLPSDGSDAGWRDPVISFSAFVDEGDGCWKPLARVPVLRCGLFDANWTDDVVRLTAGQKRVIDPLWGFPSFQWRAGTVRLFLHYTWTGGAASKGGATQSIDPTLNLGAMSREAPYELVSNAIEFEVAV